MGVGDASIEKSEWVGERLHEGSPPQGGERHEPLDRRVVRKMLRDPRGPLVRQFAESNAAMPAPGAAVAMLNIDHFKAIDDRHSHAGGHEAPTACARVIAEAMSRPGFAARICGEEFAVLMSGLSHAEAQAAAEALRSAIARTPVVIDHRLVGMTVSIGLHQAVSGFASFVQAMRAADAKLHLIEAADRNRVEWAATA